MNKINIIKGKLSPIHKSCFPYLVDKSNIPFEFSVTEAA